MNPPFDFVRNRQFWAGVAATIVVGILASAGVPNLLRTRMFFDEARASFSKQAVTVATVSEAYEDTDAMSVDQNRKTIRTAAIDLIVKSPKEAAEKIRLLVEQAGGFLVSAETLGGENAPNATVTVRIPVDRFDQIRAKVISLGTRVESEKLETQDVTKQYVDSAARLRNLRAQETQYLGILKQARTVKDTVEVSDKLNEVRGQIDQQQAEFDALSKQVETVALTVSLQAEAEANVFGLHWRPLYQLKLAAREGIDGLGDYAAAMASFVFYIPAILLWLATILVGAALGWRILRWAGRILFVPRAKLG